MRFADFGLSPALERAVDALGFEKPTPIQAEAIPVALKGRDVIGIAETGSGKTISYLIPISERLLASGSGLRALIIAPTRELALQIESVAADLGKDTGLRAVAVIGGVRMTAQVQRLRRGADILIATPGRLLDLCRSGHVWLDAIQELVLDEADRLLDMGFLPDVRLIMRKLPRDRRTMLYSATFPVELEGLIYEFMRDPETLEIGRRAKPVDTVHQVAYSVMSHHKMPLLLRLASEKLDGQALIFTRTKRAADNVGHILQANGHSVETMHADRTQQQRVQALERFRAGQVKMLVATDIAARGIDVEKVAYVINYDIPGSVDDYVHRIGRTARAGRQGTAVTFVAPVEEFTLRDIERVTGQPITREALDNFSDGRTASVSAAANVQSRPAAAAFRSRRRRR